MFFIWAFLRVFLIFLANDLNMARRGEINNEWYATNNLSEVSLFVRYCRRRAKILPLLLSNDWRVRKRPIRAQINNFKEPIFSRERANILVQKFLGQLPILIFVDLWDLHTNRVLHPEIGKGGKYYNVALEFLFLLNLSLILWNEIS